MRRISKHTQRHWHLRIQAHDIKWEIIIMQYNLQESEDEH